eukprot:7386600-Prymnesium_polylepis.1
MTGWGSRERTERGVFGSASAASGERGFLAPQAKTLRDMCSWMLMTTIWHTITFTKRFKAHVLLRLMGLLLYAETVVATSSELVTTYRLHPSNPLQERSSLL